MAFVVDNNTGAITCYQGDSGEITFSGIPTDKNYKLYFAVQDENRKLINEIKDVATNKNPNVTVLIPANFSDEWKVSAGDEFTTYYYGVKICDPTNGKEDTLMIGNSTFGDYSELIVYPKKVEGLE